MRVLPPSLIVLAALAGMPAAAQGSVCGQREMIVQRLLEQFGETRQSMGLQRDSGVVEIFASLESGTWTILLTLPNGLTCLVAAGEAWDSTATPRPPKGKAT
ncbi:MAG: hypothetical protein KatS3mg118_1640 [Paracoccaceae bacterium]|nr:MAG: hypothetical protein D6686_03170 [Alphaproteobacteria bacterium]GIX13681.1 MAG: hypothetical protein KatS3mg118_1640 [Paracoccaceae bacterium]